MCGPLASACGVVRSPYYHLGRVLTYTLVGMGLGASAEWIKPVFFASELAFLGMLWAVFFVVLLGLVFKPQVKVNSASFFQDFLNTLFSKVHGHPTRMGILTVALPCFWLWSYFLIGIAYGSWWRSGGVLFVFGMGTLAWPLAIRVLEKWDQGRKKNTRRRVFAPAPLAMFALFFTLVLRTIPIMKQNGSIPLQNSLESALEKVHQFCFGKPEPRQP